MKNKNSMRNKKQTNSVKRISDYLKIINAPKERMLDLLCPIIGLDEVGMPIIAIDYRGKLLYFIVDTGSNNNYLSRDVCNEYCEYIEIVDKHNMTLVGCNSVDDDDVMEVKMDIDIKGITYRVKFVSFQADKIDFDTLGRSMGCRIDGILGLDFMINNSVVIDFVNYNVFTIPKKKRA